MILCRTVFALASAEVLKQMQLIFMNWHRRVWKSEGKNKSV